MEYQYKLDYSLIAKRVKRAREAAHLTQAELAEKIDITTNAVAQMETDRMHPKLQTLLNIANVLQLDVNYFLRSSPEQAGEIDELTLSLNSRLNSLSDKDKIFLLRIIEGLKKYNEDS